MINNAALLLQGDLIGDLQEEKVIVRSGKVNNMKHF